MPHWRAFYLTKEEEMITARQVEAGGTLTSRIREEAKEEEKGCKGDRELCARQAVLLRNTFFSGGGGHPLLHEIHTHVSVEVVVIGVAGLGV